MAQELASQVPPAKKRKIEVGKIPVYVGLRGGTFGSEGGDKSYRLPANTSLEQQRNGYNAQVKRPENIDAIVQEHAPAYYKDSRDVTPADLLASAKHQHRAVNNVYINGTDGLVHAALMDLIANPADPQGINAWAGAMKPSNSSTADGPGNATDAEIVATSRHPALLGHTVIVMNGLILDPRNARKVHTSSTDSFQPIEGKPIGTIKDGKITITNPPPPVPQTFNLQGVKKLPAILPFRIDITESPDRHWMGLEKQIDLETPSEAEDKKDAGGYKKVILVEGAGDGIVSQAYVDKLSRLALNGDAIVLRSPGLHEGSTSPGMEDEKLGFIHIGDIKPFQLRIYMKCYMASLRKQGKEPTIETTRDFVATMQFRNAQE